MQKQLLTFFALIGAAACGDDHSMTPMPDAAEPMPDAPVDSPPEVPACQPKALRTDLTWAGSNRTALEGWLASRGCNSAGYDKNKKPVALFDWDNTISKNDFGDAITFWFVTNNKIIRPAAWTDTSAFMTADGAAALSAACDSLAAVGQPLPTSTNAACANEILSMYIDNATVGGKVAFANHDYRRMEPTYAWTAQLMAGYTDAEITQFATSAITPQLAAAEGASQTIGAKTVNGWLRIYDQTKDLIEVTKSYGYDVWIITASPQPVIQAFSPMVGIAPDHVIGIRSMLDTGGKRTYKFHGCGDTLDDNQTMISYMAGKRCWVNKVVYGDITPNAMRRRADGDRQVFAAGDSDTDIEFLRDATYRLVIDRNKTELMCNAFYGLNAGWLVNPMFIAPKTKKLTAYPCATTGFKTEIGGTAPIRDDANNIIPNQLEP